VRRGRNAVSLCSCARHRCGGAVVSRGCPSRRPQMLLLIQTPPKCDRAPERAPLKPLLHCLQLLSPQARENGADWARQNISPWTRLVAAFASCQDGLLGALQATTCCKGHKRALSWQRWIHATGPWLSLRSGRSSSRRYVTPATCCRMRHSPLHFTSPYPSHTAVPERTLLSLL
jgi:hypothetical protein